MIKRRILSILILLISVTLLTGCGYSVEEKVNMAMYEKVGKQNAIGYIEQKYGFTPKVVKVECAKNESSAVPNFSPKATGDVYVKMKYKQKDFFVYIDGKTSTTEGYDNYQIEEIRKAFVEKMEDVLNYDIRHVEFAYGLDVTTEIEEQMYGLVNDYFNGQNLNEVLGNSYYNSASINYIYEDDCNISLKNITENFGENTNYLFVNYKDESSYNLIEDYRFEIHNDYLRKVLSSEAILVRDYTVICRGQKEYTKCKIKEKNDFYYSIDDDSSYCYFTETSLDDTYNWKGRGFLNPQKVYDAYEINTDSSRVNVWIPMELIEANDLDSIMFVSQYLYEGDKSYRSFPTTKRVGEDKYLYVSFTIRDYKDYKFSIFKDLE